MIDFLAELRRQQSDKQARTVLTQIMACQVNKWSVEAEVEDWREPLFVDRYFRLLQAAESASGRREFRLVDAGYICSVEVRVVNAHWKRSHDTVLSYFVDTEPAPETARTPELRVEYQRTADSLHPLMRTIVADSRFEEESARLLLASSWFRTVRPMAQIVWELVGRKFPHLLATYAKQTILSEADSRILIAAFSVLLQQSEFAVIHDALSKRGPEVVGALMAAAAVALPTHESILVLEQFRPIVERVGRKSIKGSTAIVGGYGTWIARVAREQQSLDRAVDSVVEMLDAQETADPGRAFAFFSGLSNAWWKLKVVDVHPGQGIGEAALGAASESALAQAAVRCYERSGERSVNSMVALARVCASAGVFVRTARELLAESTSVAARNDVIHGLSNLQYRGLLEDSASISSALSLGADACSVGKWAFTTTRLYSNLLRSIGGHEALKFARETLNGLTDRPPQITPGDWSRTREHLQATVATLQKGFVSPPAPQVDKR